MVATDESRINSKKMAFPSVPSSTTTTTLSSHTEKGICMNREQQSACPGKGKRVVCLGLVCPLPSLIHFTFLIISSSRRLGGSVS